MSKGRKGVHLFAVKENIQFHQVRLAEARLMVVERSIAFGDGLQFVVEIYHYLAQWQVEVYLDAVAGYILLLDQLAAFVEAKRHYRADIGSGGDDRGTDVWLLYSVNQRRVRHAGRVVNLVHLTIFGIDAVTHVRHRGNHIHVELTVQTLLHYLHVKQAQKTAAETKPQSHGTLGREGERGIVKLQFLKRRAQVLKILRLYRIHAGKNHRLDLLKTLNRFLAGPTHMRDGVPHFHLSTRLDAGDDVTHIAGGQLFLGLHVHLQHTYLVCIVLLARVEELHHVALTNPAVHHLEVRDDAAERVENRVKDQCLKRRIGVTLRSRNALHDSVQRFLYTHTRLGAHAKYLLALAAQ